MTTDRKNLPPAGGSVRESPSLSGDIVNKGVYELPTNATLRELIEEFGGGIKAGHHIKAVQMGGGSCGFLLPEQLDVKLDFDSMRKAGASLGSGAVLVLDETHNMAEFVRGHPSFLPMNPAENVRPAARGRRGLRKSWSIFAMAGLARIGVNGFKA